MENNDRKENDEKDQKDNELDEQKQEDPLPAITGDFSAWTQQQIIRYFLALNDPARPLYAKDELASLQLRQLQAWAIKANQIQQAFVMQGKIPPQQLWIPAVEGKVPMPVGAEIDVLITSREQLTVMQGLLAKKHEEEKQQQKAQNEAQQQQQRKQGVKRKFEDYYAPMPEGEKYEKVEAKDAATFVNGGFSAVQADVDALMGIQFFKVKNGNGQVYYMALFNR